MNPPRPHADWNRRRRTAPPPTLRRRKPNRSWSNISTATGSHRRKRSRPTSSPTRKPWKPSTSWPNNIPRASESPPCAATDTETANATTSKLQAIEKKHTGNLSRLKKAAGAVFSSRLAHTVEQGERLYSSSEGKVQDEYSRALLRASIDKRDEKAITDAMDKVNASIDAKTPRPTRKGKRRRRPQRLRRRRRRARRHRNSTRTRPPAPLRARVPARRAADTIPPAVPPARPVVPRLRAGRCPRTRTPRNCPAPTRAYERTNTMPQLTTLIPSFAAPVTDRVWLVGAHGGAGCTTIRHSDPERFQPTPAARCR